MEAVGTQLGKEGVNVMKRGMNLEIETYRKWWEISELQRSKRWEIQASFDPK